MKVCGVRFVVGVPAGIAAGFVAVLMTASCSLENRGAVSVNSELAQVDIGIDAGAGSNAVTDPTNPVVIALQAEPKKATPEKQAPLTLAEQDALNAFNEGDKRLVGVRTRGISVPGVDEASIQKIRKRYGIKVSRASDVIRNKNDRNSLIEVFQYARQYNNKLVKLLRTEL